jgi:transcriptional regulator with XRE-family HTH domain
MIYDLDAYRPTPKPRSLVDCMIGERLRRVRVERNMTEPQLSLAVGISESELQLFEAGQSRIGASRLFHFAKALNVPVAAFLEALDLSKH